MTSPYYSDENVTLYHGDCLEHPEWWTDADVLVTDPPYGIGYKQGQMTGATRELRAASRTYLKQTGQYGIKSDKDITARDKALKLWGKDRPGIVFGHWRRPRPENTVMRLLWIKREPGTGLARPRDTPWITRDEEIYVIGEKTSPFVNGTVETNIYETSQMISNLIRGDGHPTAKPLGLMQRLVQKCPKGLIADPFAGSGSTLVAAKLLGRHAVGVELEERYCEVAARRLSQGVLDFGEWSA